MARIRILQPRQEYMKQEWKPKSIQFRQKYRFWKTIAILEIFLFILVFLCRAIY